MRKFKLIKQYPGSGAVETIVELTERMNLAYFTDNPDFYEEVVEKDYEILISRVVPKEILSVKRLSDGEVFTVGDKVEGGIILGIHIDKFYTGGLAFSLCTSKVESLCSIEKVIEKDYEIVSYVAKDNPNNITTKRRGAHLHEEYWKIHSIKRLSDGEVFTVGDKITGYSYEDARSIQTIKLCRYIGRIKLEQYKGFTELHSATKAKQPIFLTHDGKDIFEGDTIWYVNKENFYYDYIITHSGVKFNSDLNAYFLTREEAEDYIKRNKVLFTTEDGVGIKKGDMIHGIYRTTNAISNTVVGFNNGVCDPFVAIFSTRAAAENYLVQKSHSLSIEDFWEFVCWGGSNIAKSKRLKRLVKDRLGIK